MQVLDIILGSFLSMGLTYALVRCDRLLMSDLQRQRGWNAATTGAAIFTFSPFCVVAHFWVTRRTFRGLLAGFAALALVLVVQIGLTLLYQEVGLISFTLVLVLQPIVISVIPIVIALTIV